MDYRREHEAMFSELSEKELNQLFVMDEYGVENSHFTVHGYDMMLGSKHRVFYV